MVLHGREVDVHGLAPAQAVVHGGGVAAGVVVERAVADERLPLRQLRVAFAHVAQEDDVLLPIRAEHLGKGRVGIDLQQRADQTGRQHVALTGVALPALHDLAALDERHLRQTADIEREEVDRRGVQAVVLHPLPDGKAGAGGFAVFGLEGDVGIVMRRIVRELRVDLLLGDLRQILLHDLGGHILDLDADVVLIALVGDEEVAHAGERAADGADLLGLERLLDRSRAAHAHDLGDDLAVQRMADAEIIRLAVPLEQVAHILHAVDAVVGADAALVVGDLQQLIVGRGVEDDDRRVKAQQRLNGLQGRGVGQMLRDDSGDAGVVELLRRAVELRLDAADLVRQNDLKALAFEHLDEHVHVIDHRVAVMRVGIVIQLDVQRQIADFDLFHIVCSPVFNRKWICARPRSGHAHCCT